MVTNELLKKVYLFDGFTDAELGQVAALIKDREVIAGDYVFDEGAQATSMFILKSGTIEILKRTGEGEEQKVATFASGSHFGEMAFLDRSARTASALARENARLLELPYDALEATTQRNRDLGLKLYRSFAQALCRRIRQTTMDLSNLKELKLRHL